MSTENDKTEKTVFKKNQVRAVLISAIDLDFAPLMLCTVYHASLRMISSFLKDAAIKSKRNEE